MWLVPANVKAQGWLGVTVTTFLAGTARGISDVNEDLTLQSRGAQEPFAYLTGLAAWSKVLAMQGASNHSSSAGSSRQAEKDHVRRMEDTEWLEIKPFLGGTGYDVDRALVDITFFSSIVSSIPCGPGSLVLDLGSGPCWISDWLQKLRFRTLSVDLSEDMLKIGRKRLAIGSALLAGDMAALPLQNHSVDAIVCYSALHHVPNWTAAVREAFRVLKPGGVLVLQEPGRGHSREAESRAQMEQFGVLEQDLPASVLCEECRLAGFTRTVVRPVAELSFGRSRILPPYPFWKEAPRLFARKRLSRITATIVEGLLNLVSPFHIVVAVKGNAWADSRRPDTMVARFLHVNCPSSTEVGRATPFIVKILNTGLTRWLAKTDTARRGQVRLGVSLVDEQSRLRNMDFLRFDLPRNVEPGNPVEIAGEIPAFSEPFRGALRFDLVAEGVHWFSARGSKPFVHPFRVG